jgi:ubiquitin-protein ligase
MISFACQQCGKPFSVPDAYAGRSARCKGCGTTMTIPATVPAPQSGQEIADRSSVSPRTRRLRADAEQMNHAFANCEHIAIESTSGDPPDTYEIKYTVKSLAPGGKKPVERREHKVRIALPADYPRLPPHCSMLTPIFHPNINEASICVGDHWAAGERLVDLVVRIAEMLAFQAYNIRSPLDGEAAMWADLNVAKLPTDPRPMRPASLE